MAPLPEDNTERYFLFYTVSGHTHSLTIRCEDGTSAATISEEVSAFLEAAEPMLYSTQFVKLEMSANGSNVRVPATWSGVTEWGTGAGPERNAPQFVSFTGKSVDGRRFRVELFGRIGEASDNWRIYAVDNTAVEESIAALATVEPVFLTISGAAPFLNAYANQSIAQHWVGELRN